MSKKKTATKKTRTKTAKAQPVRPITARPRHPKGLRLFFRLVRDPDDMQIAAVMDANRAYPVAQEIIRRSFQDVEAQEETVHVLMASVEHMFGRTLPEDDWITEPSHVADAAYRMIAFQQVAPAVQAQAPATLTIGCQPQQASTSQVRCD
jgi:hypothetical protein